MLLMNKIALKKSEDGKGVRIKNRQQQPSLFGAEGTDINSGSPPPPP